MQPAVACQKRTLVALQKGFMEFQKQKKYAQIWLEYLFLAYPTKA
jgi:hypothetical protein